VLIESEHGTVDIEKYNASLKREPERDELRVKNTAPNLHAKQQATLRLMGCRISDDGHRLVPISNGA
jgi:hypothetical protein